MKRTVLCMASLLLASLCQQPTNAAPTYAASATLVAPVNGDTYALIYPAYVYHVPVKVTKHWTEVNGAAPSTMVSMGWDMANSFAAGSNSLSDFSADYTAPTTNVMTDATGHYRHGYNGGSGDYSTTVDAGAGSSYKVDIRSNVKDARGISQTIVHATATFDVFYAI